MDTVEREAHIRVDRLAEMVWHLTQCDPHEALAVVDKGRVQPPSSHDESLLVVAQAMCELRRLDLTEKLDLREQSPDRRPAITS
jgi:hypothetical protein